ncbi:hypothetical protein ACTA71_010986 [Dictyostelium dimigraforme]
MKFIFLVLLLLILKQCSSEYCEENYCVGTMLCYDFVGCDNSTCLYEEKDHSDGLECTVDTCDGRNGTINIPNDSLCPQEDSCFSYYCNIETGCQAVQKVNCPEPNICQIELGCIKESGQCEFQQIDCDDENDCTFDYCDPLNGGCLHVLNDTYCSIQANHSLCHQDGICTPNGCYFEDVVCDDGNPCSEDYCDVVEGCSSILNDLNCEPENKCYDSVCTTSGCVQLPINCDDGNPCSVDSCDPQIGCISTLNNTLCNTGNKCLNSICTVNGCSSTPIVCNDGISCTDDNCNPSLGCQFISNNTKCDDGNKCTIDQCGTNGCSHTNKICPPKPVLLLGIGLICRNFNCDQSNGTCVPDLNTISLLC